MRRSKTKVTVRLIAIDNLKSPYDTPFLGQMGEVVSIDRGAFGGFALFVRFPEAVDMRAFGHRLEDGFLTYNDCVEVIEGNFHHAYHGEATEALA